MHRRQRRRFAALSTITIIVVGGIGIALGLGAFKSPPPPLTKAQLARQHRGYLSAAESEIAHLALADSPTPLPKAPDQPAPEPGDELFAVAPAAHQVFGYLPYWELSSVSASDLSSVSELAYFGLSLSSSGTIEQSGPGFADLSSGAFAQVLSAAHQLSDRVDLTLSTVSPSAIAALLKQPTSSGTSLAGQLAALVRQYGFDGVDLDLEGRAASERAAFVRFIAAFSHSFRAQLPSADLVLNTYPQSAGDASDFFDVAALAPYVDHFFVMAYDMVDPSNASSNDPLISKNLGLSDVQALLQYVEVVQRSKVILGMPYYGYDFTTASALIGAPAVTADPEAVLYSSILTAGHSALWDVATASPYSVFQLDGNWHETFFDDPASLAIRTSLASDFRIAGVGMWALGFEGPASAMLTALTGGAAPERS